MRDCLMGGSLGQGEERSDTSLAESAYFDRVSVLAEQTGDVGDKEAPISVSVL